MALKGLTQDQEDLLKLIFALKPWGRDKVSKKVGQFLNGDDSALDKAPVLRDRLVTAIEKVKGQK